jgi:hypothetical protein
MPSRKAGEYKKVVLMLGEKFIALITILSVGVESFVKPVSGVRPKTLPIMQNRYVE